MPKWIENVEVEVVEVRSGKQIGKVTTAEVIKDQLLMFSKETPQGTVGFAVGAKGIEAMRRVREACEDADGYIGPLDNEDHQRIAMVADMMPLRPETAESLHEVFQAITKPLDRDPAKAEAKAKKKATTKKRGLRRRNPDPS